MIVEYNIIIHSDLPNYTRLAFNSLQMIKNDPVSEPIKRDVLCGRSAAAARVVAGRPASGVSRRRRHLRLADGDDRDGDVRRRRRRRRPLVVAVEVGATAADARAQVERAQPVVRVAAVGARVRRARRQQVGVPALQVGERAFFTGFFTFLFYKK